MEATKLVSGPNDAVRVISSWVLSSCTAPVLLSSASFSLPRTLTLTSGTRPVSTSEAASSMFATGNSTGPPGVWKRMRPRLTSVVSSRMALSATLTRSRRSSTSPSVSAMLPEVSRMSRMLGRTPSEKARLPM